MSIELKLSRTDRVYRPGESVKGVVLLSGGRGVVHEGVQLLAEGNVTLQLSSKSVGLFEAFYSSTKPISLFNHASELVPPGKLAEQQVEVPFEIPISAVRGERLFETYHGVFVNVQYMLSVELKRGMLSKSLKRQLEFVVEAPDTAPPLKPQPVPFSIVPESLENVKQSSLRHVPSLKVSGRLDSVLCSINEPLEGEVTVEHCSAAIKSVELQLVRIETCHYSDGVAREATEIQNIQIGDGPVCHGWPIPVHMVFPRLFTCPTINHKSFKIEFEVNLVILFADGHLLTENFPVRLVRMNEALVRTGDGS